MKRLGLFALVIVLFLGLSIFFAACSGGGGGSSPAPGGGVTSLSTTTQGAQSASASVTSALNVASTGVQLSNIASTGGSLAVPRFNAFAGANTKTTAVSKFAARFSPVVRKARAMRASATGYPMAISCDSRITGTVAPLSPDSTTIDVDTTGSNFTITFTQCQDTSTNTLTDGVMAIAGTGTSGTFTLGSASRLFTVTDYSPSAPTAAIAKSQANVTMSVASTGISATGSFEEWDYVAHTHDLGTLTNFSVTAASTTTTINSTSYNVDTLTVGGSESATTYVSDTDSTINYNETAGFTNFSVAYKTPASGTGNEYLSINGAFSSSTTPAKCIDGTFSIVTNTDIEIDPYGVTQAGQVTINSNVVATFQANGAVSVSVNGGAAQIYTEAQLNSVCAL